MKKLKKSQPINQSINGEDILDVVTFTDYVEPPEDCIFSIIFAENEPNNSL